MMRLPGLPFAALGALLLWARRRADIMEADVRRAAANAHRGT